MANKTSIEWTQGDDGTPGATWNPVTGCDEVSEGCDLCYAKTFAERWRGTPGHYFENGFDVTLRPGKLGLPLKWVKPRRIFVNSMSDLFHAAVPTSFIAEVFAVMTLAPRHTFQILTKRPGRMSSLLNSEKFQAEVAQLAMARAEATPGPPYLPEQYVVTAGKSWWPLPNVQLGVSVENQKWAEIRIPLLLQTPAAVRMLSCEPLLGPIDLTRIRWGGHFGNGSITHLDVVNGYYGMPDVWKQKAQRVDWVIVGGESGAGSRLMEAEWARSLRDQCADAGVPFFFKQAGTALARQWGMPGKGHDLDTLPDDLRVREYPATS